MGRSSRNINRFIATLVISVILFTGYNSAYAYIYWNNTDDRITITEVAKGFIGIPYKYGGNSLKGIDCSSLVQKLYGMFDIIIPRTTREQLKIGRIVSKYELEYGDLVFFRSEKGNHVGIYVGENKFVHASSLKVKIDNLDHPYFKKRFITAIRVREL